MAHTYVHFNFIMDTALGPDRTVEVCAYVTYGSRGSRDEFGVPMEPDDLPTVEIQHILDMSSPSTGNWINPRSLSCEDIDRAHILAMEHARDNQLHHA